MSPDNGSTNGDVVLDVLEEYEAPEGRRQIVSLSKPTGEGGQLLILGMVDRALAPRGRNYAIASGIGPQELASVLDDYRQQRDRFGLCPMSRQFISKMLEGGDRQREAIC